MVITGAELPGSKRPARRIEDQRSSSERQGFECTVEDVEVVDANLLVEVSVDSLPHAAQGILLCARRRRAHVKQAGRHDTALEHDLGQGRDLRRAQRIPLVLAERSPEVVAIPIVKVVVVARRVGNGVGESGRFCSLTSFEAERPLRRKGMSARKLAKEAQRLLTACRPKFRCAP